MSDLPKDIPNVEKCRENRKYTTDISKVNRKPGDKSIGSKGIGFKIGNSDKLQIMANKDIYEILDAIPEEDAKCCRRAFGLSKTAVARIIQRKHKRDQGIPPSPHHRPSKITIEQLQIVKEFIRKREVDERNDGLGRQVDSQRHFTGDAVGLHLRCAIELQVEELQGFGHPHDIGNLRKLAFLGTNL